MSSVITEGLGAARTREPDAPCRPGCGACCIAPSISSPIPGMPNGKLAGLPCVQLDAQRRCRIFDSPERPAVCAGLQPSREMCGSSVGDAMLWLHELEAATSPMGSS